MITDERIKELRELCNKATVGEWYITNGMQIASTSGGKYEIVTDQAMYESDAAFIAASRTVIPELLDEIERLKTIIEKVNSYDPHIIPDIQSGAITIHD